MAPSKVPSMDLSTLIMLDRSIEHFLTFVKNQRTYNMLSSTPSNNSRPQSRHGSSKPTPFSQPHIPDDDCLPHILTPHTFGFDHKDYAHHYGTAIGVAIYHRAKERSMDILEVVEFFEDVIRSVEKIIRGKGKDIEMCWQCHNERRAVEPGVSSCAGLNEQDTEDGETLDHENIQIETGGGTELMEGILNTNGEGQNDHKIDDEILGVNSLDKSMAAAVRMSIANTGINNKTAILLDDMHAGLGVRLKNHAVAPNGNNQINISNTWETIDWVKNKTYWKEDTEKTLSSRTTNLPSSPVDAKQGEGLPAKKRKLNPDACISTNSTSNTVSKEDDPGRRKPENGKLLTSGTQGTSEEGLVRKDVDVCNHWGKLELFFLTAMLDPLKARLGLVGTVSGSRRSSRRSL
ncbi:hypothetical protein B0J14DRAFT_576102 [Halenospora varia]|nr:hypothetical protein B0J14DRAFT_576102 [Halenospora varia]